MVFALSVYDNANTLSPIPIHSPNRNEVHETRMESNLMFCTIKYMRCCCCLLVALNYSTWSLLWLVQSSYSTKAGPFFLVHLSERVLRNFILNLLMNSFKKMTRSKAQPIFIPFEPYSLCVRDIEHSTSKIELSG